MVLGLEEESIITDETLEDGKKGDLVYMIHLYNRFDLLGSCIKDKYSPVTMTFSFSFLCIHTLQKGS